jgi:hypothetical protein
MSNVSIDMVLCINADMPETQLKNTIRDASQFPRLLTHKMRQLRYSIEHLRFRYIAFRATTLGDPHPPCETGFIDPYAEHDLERFIRQCGQLRNGNLLSALSSALNSPWTKATDSRHIIVLWTNSDPVISDVSFDELTGRWEQLDYQSKRLMFFAPDGPIMDKLSSTWENVVYLAGEPGNDLDPIDLDEITDVLARQIPPRVIPPDLIRVVTPDEPLSAGRDAAVQALHNELREDLVGLGNRTGGRLRGPSVEAWEVVLIYISTKALDAITGHALDAIIDKVTTTAKRWAIARFRHKKSKRPEYFAILDDDGNVLRSFKIDEAGAEERTEIDRRRSSSSGDATKK